MARNLLSLSLQGLVTCCLSLFKGSNPAVSLSPRARNLLSFSLQGFVTCCLSPFLTDDMSSFSLSQAVHDKYKAKHLAQMRAVQSYEERVVDQDRLRSHLG